MFRADVDTLAVLQASAIIVLSAETVSVEGISGESVRVVVRTPEGERKIEGSDLLVATGRVPDTAGIGLDNAGVELDKRGYIRAMNTCRRPRQVYGPLARR